MNEDCREHWARDGTTAYQRSEDMMRTVSRERSDNGNRGQYEETYKSHKFVPEVSRRSL